MGGRKKEKRRLNGVWRGVKEKSKKKNGTI